MRSAYARTGAAVLASGVTATAGFAVLIASDIRMLRDFGFVTVIDLAVALLGVMVALPAALVWAGSGEGRYSIVVGLIFAAVIVDRRPQHASADEDEGTLGLDKRPARWPLPEFAVPGRRRPARRRRERRPGRLRNLAGCPARRRPPRPRLPGPARRARSASATSSTARW